MYHVYEVQRRTCWKRKEKPSLTRTKRLGKLTVVERCPGLRGGGADGCVHFRLGEKGRRGEGRRVG